MPFGGINIIFAGDFHQLPPVGGTPLYQRLDGNNDSVRAQTVFGQKAMAGQLLWLGVNRVHILKEQMCQTGDKNNCFWDLLTQVSTGVATEEDYDLLSTCIVDNVNIDLSCEQWSNCPVITRQNQVKDAINLWKTQTFASHYWKELHYYYAEDFQGGEIVMDSTLQQYLYDLHSR